uniref:Uncharacterized protein n=1 Tax=Ciona savignyi TaxID=51511 RepID=H2Y464_CIOSA
MKGNDNLLIIDKELQIKVKRCCDDVNKTAHLVANEPSLGLYRIQQHIRKSLPRMVDCQVKVKSGDVQLQGLVYDMTSARDVTRLIEQSESNFSEIESLLSRATTAAAISNMKR